MRVLVADDSVMYRRMLQTLLEEWGYEVVLAADGHEALAILDSNDAPVLALLNCFMPGLGGLELCKLIRARERGYIYTILLSAVDHESDVLRGFELGADDYLCKPFKELELKARIKVGERIMCRQEALVNENHALSVEASHDSLLRLWNRKAIFACVSKRLEVRHSLALPVRVWGMDATGQMFEEYATTVDVTTTGAYIAGIKRPLQRGCVIGVEHRSSRARYRVTWVESADDGKSGKVGVQLIETGKFIWGSVIPRVFGDSEDAECPNTELSR